mmetsp:Transcript_32621/g.89970  ORF Transcript_32621/g.89970 Transcript_32621/m.89970 type:complete len:170 (-) Transcript_32621:153-662(-)|eukprot:CAMPEP_0117467540 /NCGR_PEP_ID=MMETSP0784-20121206/5709_1 /TAXON_ID=39447 /ORGANISM="" /LENGTH=169 /DNA_ID=CAMNT_0005261513 /DNA_START=66 /DNA_END=575 /DNA_ORIENTATION=+
MSAQQAFHAVLPVTPSVAQGLWVRIAFLSKPLFLQPGFQLHTSPDQAKAVMCILQRPSEEWGTAVQDLVGLRATVGFGAVEEEIVDVEIPGRLTYANVGGFAPLQDHRGVVECRECMSRDKAGVKLSWTMSYTTPWFVPSALPRVGMEALVPVFMQRLQVAAETEASRA